MLKIAGVILCTIGCAGYGFSKITGWKKELEEINLWILVFQKIKSRILYQREPLGEICLQMEEEGLGVCGKMTGRVGRLSTQKRSVEFADIWRSEIKNMEKESFLSGKKKELLYKFPDYV
ncbi:MAG: stage III sporulation protein AB, partial [Lachnospiraceae bacterium]|nr:stage III sporulation protein AB [Lachnospiraceae bacterium]